MNPHLNTFLTALAAVAGSAVLALALAEPAAPVQPQQGVVKLERVVVIGKRPAAVTEVAMAKVCRAETLC